jgi:geranylgeranyl diphosphate synthase type II
VTAPVELREYLRDRRARVDAALERFLPATPACPTIIADAMRYSLFAGGKRLRPLLALAAAEAVVPPDASRTALDLALPAACAIELVHTYSLVHDDLPAMDNDTLRRGRPTSHVVFGEGTAILVGDGLLTEAFAIMAREPEARDPSIAVRKLRTIAIVAEAAGACGMVGGQAIDLAAAGAPLDARDLRAMHARKTGALIRASVVAGAIMAGADGPTLAAVAQYGDEIGLAFQIIDDVLDVEGAASELGKTAGKDAASGKPTYPGIHGIEGSRGLAREALDRALTALAGAGVGGRLPELAAWVVTRTN